MSAKNEQMKEITVDLDLRTWATIQVLADKAGVPFEEFAARMLEEHVGRKYAQEVEEGGQ